MGFIDHLGLCDALTCNKNLIHFEFTHLTPGWIQTYQIFEHVKDPTIKKVVLISIHIPEKGAELIERLVEEHNFDDTGFTVARPPIYLNWIFRILQFEISSLMNIQFDELDFFPVWNHLDFFTISNWIFFMLG